MGLLKICIDRWKSETPSFFKGIKKLSMTLGSSATSIWLINESMSLGLHEDVLSICKYLIAVAAAMGVTAQFTKVDPQQPKNPSL